MTTPQFFTIIPAAGLSQRMGQPKLLLPWGDKTLLEHMLTLWSQCHVTRILLVIAPEDTALHSIANKYACDMVIPAERPVDMKASVWAGIAHLEQYLHAAEHDAILLAPADMPFLSPLIVQHLCQHYAANPASILVPTWNGKRGHPLLLPYFLAREIGNIPAELGINTWLKQKTVTELACEHLISSEQVFADIDTPDDYQQALRDI
jgi:molybdenum cofactor cytidylyltransferase